MSAVDLLRLQPMELLVFEPTKAVFAQLVNVINDFTLEQS